MSRYAISDIHGCCATFRFMVEQEIKLTLSDTLYLLGDYIDRGPDSKGVLDYIMGLQQKGFQVRALRGNHEEMMLKARTDAASLHLWLHNGGKAALASFGCTRLEQIPAKYWQWLSSLGYYFELEEYLLVHAGFNFAAVDPFTDTEAMLWTREFAVDPKWTGGRKIIHGHTPARLEKIKASLSKPLANSLSVDAGCVFWSSFGHLAALNLDTMLLLFVANKDQ